ncbi:hypothetical protein [Clostridium magnum]|nr:hypothetical protein [Clostridium magnum]SHJ14553.1 hypothetical protein SAMN02745944_05443 [Clostridium magnum DSM 2767]
MINEIYTEVKEDAKARFIADLAIERSITYKQAEKYYEQEFEC